MGEDEDKTSRNHFTEIELNCVRADEHHVLCVDIPQWGTLVPPNKILKVLIPVMSYPLFSHDRLGKNSTQTRAFPEHLTFATRIYGGHIAIPLEGNRRESRAVRESHLSKTLQPSG